MPMEVRLIRNLNSGRRGSRRNKKNLSTTGWQVDKQMEKYRFGSINILCIVRLETNHLSDNRQEALFWSFYIHMSITFL